MKETLLLIDSHALIYRFFYALPPLTTPAGESVGSIYGLARLILNIFKEKKRDYVIATFDRPEKTFRAEVFKEYKIQRPKPAPELISQFNKARELFEQFGVKVIEKAGYEADDLIGSLAEKFKNEPDLITSILSGDLDNLQLVDNDKIVVEIIKKGTSDVEIYNEVAVKNRYGLTPKQLPDLKGLVGDTSDNIPGVKGVGYKTAIPLLQKYGSLENIFNNLWEISDKIGVKLEAQKEIALLSKELATIKKDVPLEIKSLNDFKLRPYDKNSLISHFQKLGFNSLIDKL